MTTFEFIWFASGIAVYAHLMGFSMASQRPEHSWTTEHNSQHSKVGFFGSSPSARQQRIVTPAAGVGGSLASATGGTAPTMNEDHIVAGARIRMRS